MSITLSTEFQDWEKSDVRISTQCTGFPCLTVQVSHLNLNYEEHRLDFSVQFDLVTSLNKQFLIKIFYIGFIHSFYGSSMSSSV